MAQQKMHVALLRNHTSIGKLSERSCSYSTKLTEADKPRIAVNRTAFFIWEGSSKWAQGYLIVKPDGQWTRILSRPYESVDILRDLKDMDGLCVVSPAPIIPFNLHHPAYSADLSVDAKFSGIFRQRFTQQRALTNKCVKPNTSTCSCSMWSDIMPVITDVTCLKENYEVPRRKSKKKGKKKRKHNKKLHSDAVLMGAEDISTPFTDRNSTNERFDSCIMGLDGPGPGTIDLVHSSSCMYDTQAVEGEGSSELIHLRKFSPACVMDTDIDMSHLNGSQTFETDDIGAAKDVLRQHINWFECDTEVSYVNHDSFVSNSGSTCLNSVDGGDAICDVTNHTQYMSSESSSILSVDFCTQSKGKKSNSSDVPMYTKRGSHVNSMAGRCINKKSSHGHFGKENLHSVWMKVQKTDSSCVYSMDNNNNMSSESGVFSREKPHHEGYCNVTNMLPAADNLNNIQVKVSHRPKRRNDLESQQKGNCSSRKVYHPKKDRSGILLKVNQENSLNFNDTFQKKIRQTRGLNSRYHTQSNGSRVDLHNNRVDHTSVPSMKVHPQDLLIPDVVPSNDDKIDAQNFDVKHRLPTESDGSIYLSNFIDHDQPGYPDIKEVDICMEKETSFATNVKRDCNNSGFVLQKWIPVGRKVPCPTGLQRSDTSLFLHFDKPETINDCSKTTTDFTCDSIPSTTSEILDPCPIFENLQNSGEGIAEVKIPTSETITMSDSKIHFGSSISGVKEIHISSSDVLMKNIVLTVEDTFRVQVESEAVQAAVGIQGAGFEKFLHSACPVILKVDGALKCQLCHLEPEAISFVCTHDLRNLSLRSLWEWYEKHGGYGLEVREDKYDNPAFLGYREFGLRTYFVPYLSAVQLFRKCRNSYVNGLKCLCGIPSPCSDALRLSLSDCLCSLHPCSQSVDNATADHSAETYELIFEYFESEQPRQRQPLFDKIKKLIKGEGSQRQVYGDPSMLTSSYIRDLHPRSWYSVAWYPIYRIPDGNFRAAFLTYHSLGHLLHREVPSNTSQVEVVSPIVGLLSCNAQCEGWFQQSIARKSTNSTLSETIKERLRTLEQTASLLSTYAVSKGGITSVNRHPDYDFFTSRRR